MGGHAVEEIAVVGDDDGAARKVVDGVLEPGGDVDAMNQSVTS